MRPMTIPMLAAALILSGAASGQDKKITLGAAVEVPGAKVLRASDASQAIRRWHTVIAR